MEGQERLPSSLDIQGPLRGLPWERYSGGRDLPLERGVAHTSDRTSVSTVAFFNPLRNC